MCFHPMCLYSIYSDVLGEFNSGQKWAFFQSAQIIIPSLTNGSSEMPNGSSEMPNGSSEMPSILVGGTLQLHLQCPVGPVGLIPGVGHYPPPPPCASTALSKHEDPV